MQLCCSVYAVCLEEQIGSGAQSTAPLISLSAASKSKVLYTCSQCKQLFLFGVNAVVNQHSPLANRPEPLCCMLKYTVEKDQPLCHKSIGNNSCIYLYAPLFFSTFPRAFPLPVPAFPLFFRSTLHSYQVSFLARHQGHATPLACAVRCVPETRRGVGCCSLSVVV